MTRLSPSRWPVRLLAALLATYFAAVTPNAAAGAAPQQPLYQYYREELVRTGNTGHLNQLVIGFLCRSCLPESDALKTRLAARLIQDSSRTDKQVGTTVSKTGATTLTELTGFEELLAIAIEQGAVESAVNGTSVTLSTTPYMLATGLGAADTAVNWERLKLLRRIGLNASFEASGGTADLGAFQGAEAKLLILGSRSARDAALAIVAGEAVRNRLDPAGIRFNESLTKLVGRMPGLTAPLDALANWVVSKRKADAAGLSVTADDVDAKMAELFNTVPLSANDLDALQTSYDAAVAMIIAEDTASATLSQLTDEYLKKGAQLAVAYQYNAATATTPNSLSTLRILFGYDGVPGVQANLNASVDFNNSAATPAGIALKTVGAFSAEGGLTLGRFAANKADFALQGQVQRRFAVADVAAATTGSFQARLNLYLIPSLTVPVGVSWVSQDLNGEKGHVHFNIGVSLNVDSLLGVGAQGKNSP